MKYLALLSLLFVSFVSCNFSPGNSSAPRAANITNLGDIERISPLKYLALKSEYILDDNNKIIINGDLVNTASLAKYKDVVIQVFCINAEGAIIKREKVVAVDNIPANSRLSFKVALMAANGTRKVIVKLFDASGVK